MHPEDIKYFYIAVLKRGFEYVIYKRQLYYMRGTGFGLSEFNRIMPISYVIHEWREDEVPKA